MPLAPLQNLQLPLRSAKGPQIRLQSLERKRWVVLTFTSEHLDGLQKSKKPRLDVSEDTHTIGWAPPDVQADYLAEKQTATFPDATTLERDELKIPGWCP